MSNHSVHNIDSSNLTAAVNQASTVYV